MSTYRHTVMCLPYSSSAAADIASARCWLSFSDEESSPCFRRTSCSSLAQCSFLAIVNEDATQATRNQYCRLQCVLFLALLLRSMKRLL